MFENVQFLIMAKALGVLDILSTNKIKYLMYNILIWVRPYTGSNHLLFMLSLF